MRNIVCLEKANEADETSGENQLAELTEGLLMDARASINNKKILSVPVAELIIHYRSNVRKHKQ